MSNRTALGKLARNYARRLIDRDKYLKSRTDLITGIVSGKIPLANIDYKPTVPDSEDETVTEMVNRSVQKTHYSSRQNPSKLNIWIQKTTKRPNLLAATSTILLLLLIIFLYPKSPEDSGRTNTASVANAPTISTEPPHAVGTVTGSTGETLLTEFLSHNDWSHGSLDRFIESWLSLSNGERERTLKTKRMLSMNDAIYQQFLEEKALANIDNENRRAIEKQQKLIEFAQAIGINDTRMLLE